MDMDNSEENSVNDLCRNIGSKKKSRENKEILNVRAEQSEISSVYFTGTNVENHDKSLDDFVTPILPKKTVSKPANSKSKGKSLKKQAKDRKQTDIRKVLTRKQLSTYRNEISSICTEHSSDVDPEQMQLAIALSESLRDFETGSSNKESTDFTSKRITLDQFGFVPKKKVEANKKLPVYIKTRGKRARPYDLLIKTVEEKKHIVFDNYTKLIFHYGCMENRIISQRSSEKLTEALAEYHCCEASLFCKSFMSYFEMDNLDVMYVKGLFEKSSVKPGYFLKDWSKIPGRDVSPSRECTSETIDLTIDDQTELDLLMSGNRDVCSNKFKNSKLWKNNNCDKDKDMKIKFPVKIALNSSSIDAQIMLDVKNQKTGVPRIYSKSPDLFEEDTSSDCSFVFCSNNECDDQKDPGKVISISNEDKVLLKDDNVDRDGLIEGISDSNEGDLLPKDEILPKVLKDDNVDQEVLNESISVSDKGDLLPKGEGFRRSNVDINISDSDEDEVLPKVFLKQTPIDVTKNCNTTENECCSQKSCLMDLTECVGTAVLVSNDKTKNDKSFLNGMIDLTQSDIHAPSSPNDCEVTQVFESGSGICHYEAFHTSKETDDSSKCVDLSSEEIADKPYSYTRVEIERQVDKTNNRFLNPNESDSENKKYRSKGNISASINDAGIESENVLQESFVFSKEHFENTHISNVASSSSDTDHHTSISKVNTIGNYTDSQSTKLLDFSIALSDVIDISDEELNYSMTKSNRCKNYTVSKSRCLQDIETSSCNDFKDRVRIPKHSLPSDLFELGSHDKLGAGDLSELQGEYEKSSVNFELGGSSIFNQIPSFSDRKSDKLEPETSKNMIRPQNKRLEELKGSEDTPQSSSSSSVNLPVIEKMIHSGKKIVLEQQNMNLTVNVTPKNKEYIVKTDDITPLPDYESMDSPELNIYLDRYGIRKLKRKRAIQLLEHIYYQTHPLVECEDQDIPNISDELQKHPNKRKKLFTGNEFQESSGSQKKTCESDRVSPIQLNYTIKENDPEIAERQDVDLYLCSQSKVILKHVKCDPEDWIFQKREKAKVAGCRVPLHVAFHNYLMSRPELHAMILRYEPVSIDLIHKGLVLEGHRYDPKDLFRFLDKKCITIKTEDKSGAGRYSRKSSRRTK